MLSEGEEADRLGGWSAELGRSPRKVRPVLCWSLVQQLAGQGRADVLKWLNLGVRRAKEDLAIKVRRSGCDLRDLVGGAMLKGASQGGNIVMVAALEVLSGLGAICMLEANSTKVHRVVRCSMSAEISSLATAFEHGDYVRAVLAELIYSTFVLTRWKTSVAKWQHILVTDAKTGYDAVSSERRAYFSAPFFFFFLAPFFFFGALLF